MCWLKRDLWKAGIAFASMLLLLVAIVGLPVSATGTHEEIAGLAGLGTVTVQVTPTEDATVTALNKEKLAQEVQQLKNQNEPNLLGWLGTNASILIVVVGALIGLFRWLGDRRSEREKRAEERFQSVVEGFGSEREEARVSAAINLRTFLLPGYERFYQRVFGLAVAHLRLPRSPYLSEDPDGLSRLPKDQNIPLEPTALSQALSLVFKEAFPLARSQEKRSPHTKLRTDWYTKWYQSLDARGVQLDNAYLGGSADLERVWMPKASLRKADLWWINLKGAYLCQADFRWAELNGADLSESDLSGADLSGADLSEANLSEAFLNGANFSGAKLFKADLSGADFRGADLTKLEDALTLEGTKLHRVRGLTKRQLETCKAKGAIIDEAATTS